MAAVAAALVRVLAFAFTEDEAERMARAGVDAVCINLGLTERVDGAPAESALDETIGFVNRVFAAMDNAPGSRQKFFYGGGPIATPAKRPMTACGSATSF